MFLVLISFTVFVQSISDWVPSLMPDYYSHFDHEPKRIVANNVHFLRRILKYAFLTSVHLVRSPSIACYFNGRAHSEIYTEMENVQ